MTDGIGVLLCKHVLKNIILNVKLLNKNLFFKFNLDCTFRFGENIKIVHFIGAAKPWRYTYNIHAKYVTPPEDVGHGHQLSFVQAWWNVFMTSIKPRIEEAQVRALLSSFCSFESEFITSVQQSCVKVIHSKA